MAMGAPPSSGQQGNAPIWVQLVPLLLIFVISYFLLIHPQVKKQKAQEKMVKSLKPGMKVLTSGGIIGMVISVKDNSITVRSADTKLELLKSAVVDVLEKPADEEQEKK